MNKVEETELAASSSRRKTKNDLVFIAVLLVLTLVAALALILFRSVGDTVIVTVDGQTWGEYPLSEDREIEIRKGEAYNILIIKDGKAYVARASCPDGICAAHRPIGHDGQSIICLPNQVVIEVRTQKQKQPDIIA